MGWLDFTMLRSQDYPSRSAGSSAGRARVTRADTSFNLSRILFITASPVFQHCRGVVPRYDRKPRHKQRLTGLPDFPSHLCPTSCARTVCWRVSDGAFNFTCCPSSPSDSPIPFPENKSIDPTPTGLEPLMPKASRNQVRGDEGCWPMQVHLVRG